MVPLAVLYRVRVRHKHRQCSLHEVTHLALQEQDKPVEGEGLIVCESSRLLEYLNYKLLQLDR